MIVVWDIAWDCGGRGWKGLGGRVRLVGCLNSKQVDSKPVPEMTVTPLALRGLHIQKSRRRGILPIKWKNPYSRFISQRPIFLCGCAYRIGNVGSR